MRAYMPGQGKGVFGVQREVVGCDGVSGGHGDGPAACGRMGELACSFCVAAGC